MAANYYADFLSGNDANDGESWGNAVQHISKAVELVAALGTITEGITVWLKGTLAAPQTYTETSGKVDLSRLVFGPDGSLTFKTEVFNTTNYASGDADPYNASDGAGDWNPKADKPVTVPPFDIEKCKNVEFYGIAFMSTNASTGRAAAEVTEYSEVRMHYCAAEEGVVGFLAAKYSTLELYNVYAHDCRIGAAGIEFANLKVIGENFIEDNLRIGVLGWQNALVSFEAWEDDPTKYVTTIKTATPILKYYGILIRMNSTMDIRDAIFVDDDTDIAHVKILNGTAYKSDQYYGLAAESGSVATGIENLSFADANILDGKDTILEANQVVVTGGAATVSLAMPGDDDKLRPVNVKDLDDTLRPVDVKKLDDTLRPVYLKKKATTAAPQPGAVSSSGYTTVHIKDLPKEPNYVAMVKGPDGEFIPLAEARAARAAGLGKKIKNGETEVTIDPHSGCITQIKIQGKVWLSHQCQRYEIGDAEPPIPPEGTTYLYYQKDGTFFESPFGMDLFLGLLKPDDSARLMPPDIMPPDPVILFYVNDIDVRTEGGGDASRADITWTVTAVRTGHGYAFGDKEHAHLNVSVEAEVGDNGFVYFGNFEVSRPEADKIDYDDFGLYSFRYPVLDGVRIPEKTTGEDTYLVFPFKVGYLVPDPSRNLIYFRGRLSGYYPNGYSMPMQFCGFYGTTNGAYGSGWGLYFGTHDDGFFGKQFTVGPGNPFQFELSSYNDDVCKSYVPEPVDPFVDPPKGRRDIKPFVGTFCRPVWKDYRQSSYRLMMRVFNQNPADGPMAWTDLADIYKAWARRQEWAQIDRYERDRKDIGFGFYGDVGLASGFLTAEMALAAPDGKPENSYFRYIHNILKLPDEKNSFAKTLFGIAWDWHWPFGDRHDGGDQFGNNQKFWTAHYGLATQSPPYRLNFDQIKRDLGDFIVPYIFGHRMTALDPDRAGDFPGWKAGDRTDPGSPWYLQQIAPQGWPDSEFRWKQRMLCVATVAYEEFFHRRNGWIRNALVAETLDVLRLDGVYHDIAFAISGLECFNWHEPGPDDIGHGINPQPGTRHLHNGRFQVGNGGFIGATKRRLALETVYGRSDHFKGTPRKMVFGTESIVEFLIDAVDYYSTVDSLGPYKPYYLNFDVRALQPILKARGRIQEIPLLQYVYNPVMPVQVLNTTLSGGTPPHDVDETAPPPMSETPFYWLIAQTYLNGMISNLVYDAWCVDVFYQKDDPELDMDVETPAYVTSWNQSTDDPEAPQQPESIGAWPLIYIDRDDPANNIYINWLFDAWPGRHTWLPSSVFQKHCRTYVDPDKYRYLKMLAFLRHVVAPEKVIYGEMLRPPLVNDQTTNILSYKYFWPINKLVEAHRLNESGVSPPQDPIDICISNTI